MSSRVGLVITTYNNEHLLRSVTQDLVLSSVDHCVIVNGGDEYSDIRNYKDFHIIQHQSNVGPCQSRIDGINYLLEKNCEHIFIVEDDMQFKGKDIFKRYINAHNETGLNYFCFCSDAPGNGVPGNRTPHVKIQYRDEVLHFYREMNNEFTYHHASIFSDVGMYDKQFVHMWDVDFVYRILEHAAHGCGFRNFPDVHDSDDYIMNNPHSVSRINHNNNRDSDLSRYINMFNHKHNCNISTTGTTQQVLKQHLKRLYDEKNC